MNHLKPILISCLTVILMFAYQNCQKMGFNPNESGNNQSSSSDLEPATVAFELNYHMGYGMCMGRCQTGAKISADLSTGVISINNYIMNNPATLEASAEVVADPARTKFSITLSADQLQQLKDTIKAMQFEERFVPECIEGGLCTYIADLGNYLHYFKDNFGQSQKVFTESGINPNLRGETFWVMDDALPLGCSLRAIILSAGLSAQEQEDSIFGLQHALNFYEGSNPLICSEN